MQPRTTLSRLGEYKPKSSILEITEAEITGTRDIQEDRYSYPRHISQLKSPSHRGYRNTVSEIASLPKTCNLASPSTPSQVNAAVNILQYQLSDRILQENHLASVRRSLKRRLQAAKAKGDRELVDLLNDEFQQLETSA